LPTAIEFFGAYTEDLYSFIFGDLNVSWVKS